MCSLLNFNTDWSCSELELSIGFMCTVYSCSFFSFSKEEDDSGDEDDDTRIDGEGPSPKRTRKMDSPLDQAK